MLGTVMIWVSMVLLGMLAVGFMLCLVLMAFGMWWQRDDRDMVVMYGVMLLVSAALGGGLIFAVIALGRNLL